MIAEEGPRFTIERRVCANGDIDYVFHDKLSGAYVGMDREDLEDFMSVAMLAYLAWRKEE